MAKRRRRSALAIVRECLDLITLAKQRSSGMMWTRLHDVESRLATALKKRATWRKLRSGKKANNAEG